jgi:hypothetical protein
VKITRHQLLALLKSLPMIRFALMLGGGGVATVLTGWIQIWLLHGSKFPNDTAVWLARVQGAVWLGLAAWAVIALVMLALAFGRAGKLRFRAAGIEADVDFDTSHSTEGS